MSVACSETLLPDASIPFSNKSIHPAVRKNEWESTDNGSKNGGATIRMNLMLLAYTIDEWGDANIGDGVYRCYENARYGSHGEDT